jgi:hypothetical protein
MRIQYDMSRFDRKYSFKYIFVNSQTTSLKCGIHMHTHAAGIYNSSSYMHLKNDTILPLGVTDVKDCYKSGLADFRHISLIFAMQATMATQATLAI